MLQYSHHGQGHRLHPRGEEIPTPKREGFLPDIRKAGRPEP